MLISIHHLWLGPHNHGSVFVHLSCHPSILSLHLLLSSHIAMCLSPICLALCLYVSSPSIYLALQLCFSFALITSHVSMYLFPICLAIYLCWPFVQPYICVSFIYLPSHTFVYKHFPRTPIRATIFNRQLTASPPDDRQDLHQQAGREPWVSCHSSCFSEGFTPTPTRQYPTSIH